MSQEETFHLLLLDIVESMKEEYKRTLEDYESEVRKHGSHDHPDQAFQSGVRHGYYSALERLRNCVASFNVPLEELGLNDEIPL